MSYVTLEYFVCVVAVLGLATLVFLISLIVVAANAEFAYVFRAKPRAPTSTSHVGSSFGGPDRSFQTSRGWSGQLLGE